MYTNWKNNKYNIKLDKSWKIKEIKKYKKIKISINKDKLINSDEYIKLKFLIALLEKDKKVVIAMYKKYWNRVLNITGLTKNDIKLALQWKIKDANWMKMKYEMAKNDFLLLKEKLSTKWQIEKIDKLKEFYWKWYYEFLKSLNGK